MVDLAEHSQGCVRIAPVRQLLVCETGCRQYKSSYGHALDHRENGSLAE
jgi:hypothetical protein